LGKSESMENLIPLAIVFIAGYIFSVMVVLVLVKLFFPFYTKDEWTEKSRLAEIDR
jgi:hypothetical protein